ncbi:MAG: acetate--CoA ligase family protein [Ruminococcus sp.]|nr:acetate--CoA ligase family protein [Ruminococcus sp.]
MDIKKLLKPNKVAVVGASEKEGFGGDTCRNMMTYMEEDRYYFVNPRREEVFGRKCYKSISDLPEQVDLIVICTPAGTVEGLLREGAAAGAGAAVVYASGYGEVGTDEGRKKEAQLLALCEELDMALMGPNCAGFVNFVDMMYPFAFISRERDRRGGVGVLSQSGQLVLTMMDAPGTKFSYAISAGNSRITKMEDYLDFLIDDEDTKVVAMYLEGVKSPGAFIKALKKAALKKKPVVILKTGRSEKAQALAASHTGSLSGADKVYDALFEKFGVIRVDDLEELMSTARALATLKKLPEGRGFSAISLSGGETAICADLAELTGVEYVDFSQETLNKLNEVLPSYATPNNPLDSTATLSYDIEKFAGVLEIMMKDERVDFVSVGYTLLTEIADNAIYYMSEAMKLVSDKPWAKPMVMLPFSEMTRNPGYCDKLEEIGVPVLPTSLYAFKVIKNILDFVSNDPQSKNLDVVIPSQEKGDYSRAALTESESKEIIGRYGIDCGKFKVVHSPEEAAAAFDELGCEKAVAKVDSPDILHKSDVGCVKLGIKDGAGAAGAYQAIMDNAAAHCPGALVKGVQICEMAAPGVEMIIGVNNDPQFGPCVLCGLGGVFVEIFKDTSLGLAPLSKPEAMEMILSLKGAKMLQGYRGNPKCDIDALAEAIVSISNMACDCIDELLELDINPVFVRPDGICAVDALYIKKD